MTMKHAVACLLLLFIAAGADLVPFGLSAGAQPQTQPEGALGHANCAFESPAADEGWREVTIGGKFIINLPPELKQGSASGVESTFREFSNGRMRFYYVYQPYSFLAHDSRMADGKVNYQETETRIGEKKGTLFTYHRNADGRRIYASELYVGDWANSQVELIVAVESPDESDMKTARCILRTLRVAP